MGSDGRYWSRRNPHATYKGSLVNLSASYPNFLEHFMVYRALSCLSSQRHRPWPLGPTFLPHHVITVPGTVLINLHILTQCSQQS